MNTANDVLSVVTRTQSDEVPDQALVVLPRQPGNHILRPELPDHVSTTILRSINGTKLDFGGS